MVRTMIGLAFVVGGVLTALKPRRVVDRSWDGSPPEGWAGRQQIFLAVVFGLAVVSAGVVMVVT